jgi:isoleucyl-tRNA synthetase
LQTLTKLTAPVLSFTAEEIWETLHAGKDDSVFSHQYHELPEVSGSLSLLARWAVLRQLRADVLKKIESEREAGRVGSSLQAEVTLTATPAQYELLATLGDELRFVLITSSATFTAGAGARIDITPSTHKKCDRCWHYREDVGSHAEHPTICGRCISNLDGSGETRLYA